MDLNLSQLITSKSFITKTLQDIRKVIEEGADVNHQYPDLDNNTSLHLAIVNLNVACVKLLLEYHPRLNTRNIKGQTAEDLATKVSHAEITKLLRDYRNNDYDSIDPKFAIELDKNFSPENIAELNNDENFRILKIKECHSFKTLYYKFKQKSFKEAFSETSHLFAFVIEVSEDNKDDFEFPVDIFYDKRPFVVFTMQEAQMPQVYFKTSKAKRLVKLHYEQTSSQCSSESNCCPLSHFIRDSVIGELKQRLTVQDGDISRTLGVLCLRLTKLFRSNLELQILPLINSLQSDLRERLLAFYDLSFLNQEESGPEILRAIIESNDIEVLKLILNNGFESDCQPEHINTAWNLKHYECVTELLEVDSCFPDNFNLDLVVQSIDRMKIIISTRNSFHDAIKAGNIEMINDLIDKNPRWKFVYDKENKSAVTVALESKRFEIYSPLRARGFSEGIDQSFDEVSSKLSMGEKREISEINKQYFTILEQSHLMHLLSKVYLGPNKKNRGTYFAIVRSMFNKLNEIPEVQHILKYLENCNKMTIVIDLTRLHVMDMTPFGDKGTDGLTDSNRGYIYVAAQNHSERFNEIIGVLAHELMHLAMFLVYGNDCKPYYKGDYDRKKNFEEVMQKIRICCARNKSTTIDTITRVFDLYPEAYWHAELIVRVPHLCALLKDEQETLNILKQGYCKDLFEFFSNTTLLDIIKKGDLLKPQIEIEEINKIIGLHHKIVKHDYKTNRQTLFSFKTFLNREPIVVNSNVSMLTLVYICQILFKQFGKQMTKNVVFADVQSLKNPYLISKIKNVCDSKVHPVLVVETDKKNYDFYESLKSFGCKMLVISCMDSLSEEDTKKLNFKYLDLTHVWEDLDIISQQKLRQTKISFQGNEIELNKLLPVDVKELNHFPLEDLLSDQLEVNSFESKQNRIILQNFYVDRKFIIRKVQIDELRGLNSSEKKIVETEKNEDEIMQEAETRRVLIVSDVAGMGKSTSLFRIAKILKDKHKTHWVQFFDLKQHIRTFEQIKKSQKPLTKLHETLKKCINKALDQMIFLKLYEAGKTIILLDGVDEVSPDFSDLIMKALESFDVNLGNQIWIATRVHLQESLEKQLNELACKLLPITFEDKTDIVANYWKSKNKTDQDFSHLKILASNLIAKILQGLEMSKSDLMEIPLQIRMIAEIYEGITNENVQDVEEINLYSIYNAFYEKTFDNCLKNKGLLPSVSLKEMNKSSGTTILTAHHTIALCHFFESDFDFQDDVEDMTEDTKELIDKVGIAYFDSKTEKFRFIHESFAEYFIANYILANLKRKVRNQISQMFYVILTTEKYQMIRSFLNGAFKNIVMPANLNFDSLEKYLEEKKFFKLLQESVSENLDTLVQFIIATVDSFKNTELRRKIVKCKEKKNLTIMMLACNRINFESKTIRIICEYLEKLLTENELQILMFEKDIFGANVLHLVVAFCNQNNIQLLFKMVKKLFIPSERKDFICCSDKYGSNIFHYAVENDNKEIFATIQDSFKEVLPDLEIIPMLRQQNMNGLNMFHYLTYKSNKIALDNFKAFAKIVFKNDEELKLYVKEKWGLNGTSVLSLAAKKSKKDFFREIWKFLQRFYDIVELKDLLLETNKSGTNIWHFAARNYDNIEIITTIHDSFNEVFLDLEIIPMLRQRDINGFNVFHYLIYYSNETALDDFEVFVQNVFEDKEELKLWLKEKGGKDGLNALHLTAQNSKKDFFREILKFLQRFYDLVELKDLVLETAKNGMNILHFAAYNHDKQILKLFFNHLKSILNEKDLKKLIIQTSKHQSNIFHIAIQINCSRNVEVLWNIIKELLNINEQNIFLRSYDADMDNIFHLAATNVRNSLIFQALGNCSQNVLTPNEVKSLLLQKNSRGYNVIQSLILENNESGLKNFYEMIITLFDCIELQRFFIESISQSNAIQLMATHNKNVNFHESFNHILIEVFNDTKTEIKKMYLEKYENGQTAFALAAVNNQKKVYQSIWKLISEMCTFDEKTEVLISLVDNAIEIALDLCEICVNEEDSSFLMNFVQSQFQ